MQSLPTETLRVGREILDPVMRRHHFSFKEGPSGKGSGGPYASGIYTNGDRKLEVHYRFSLGLVTYHFGKQALAHEDYMRALLGSKGGNKYPGFSDDPMDAFNGLAYDLEDFATAFINGDSEEFSRCVTAAEEWKRIPGIARVP